MTSIYPGISIVVPTFREAANLPNLVRCISDMARRNELDVELLIMDDDSRDGTEETIEEMKKPWVQLVTRTGKRGLSAAVLEGFTVAKHNIWVVMDADLSHPPEAIPEMLDALADGNEMAIGSRCAPGGSIAEDWSLFRWLNSRFATLMARPLTRICGPMSGFFALSRDVFARGNQSNPLVTKSG